MHPAASFRSRHDNPQLAARTIIGTLVLENEQYLLQGDDITPGLWPVSECAEHLGNLSNGDRVTGILQTAGTAVITSRLISPGQPVQKALGSTQHEMLVLDVPQGVVLKAGDALIELRPDGTIVLNGKNIHSEASGLNQISGARLNLN